jgi:hypothetical protein
VALPLLAVVKSLLETLVWMQLCSAQGVPRFSFVHLLLGMSRPFTGAPVYSMLLTHAERLRVVGCGLKGRLARLLSLGMSLHHHFNHINLLSFPHHPNLLNYHHHHSHHQHHHPHNHHSSNALL